MRGILSGSDRLPPVDFVVSSLALVMAKEGSTISGFADAFAQAIGGIIWDE